MKALRTRRAVLGDSGAIARLSALLGYPATGEEIAVRLERIAADDDQAVWVTEGPAGEIVGWLHVATVHRLEIERFAEIGGLVVAAEQRGAGVGRQLVERAREWTVSRRLGALRVRSNVVREGAHRFYEKLGLRRTKAQQVMIWRRDPSR